MWRFLLLPLAYLPLSLNIFHSQISGFVKNNVTWVYGVFLKFVLEAVRIVTNILFQEFIPYMAKKYNFQYEFVQYKWPRWLHQQTEKQRIIWGYKILFLDVLFPLAVDKFLFVDADQVSGFEDSNVIYFKKNVWGVFFS